MPVQADAVPSECPPRLVKVKADADGKIVVSVTVAWKLKQVGLEGNRDGTGTPIMGLVPVVTMVELGNLKDLVIATAGGTKVSLKDAREKIAGGAIVVVSGDGKVVNPEFLKVFKDDTLVLVAPELIDQRPGGPQGLIPSNIRSPR
jgi:hypothetical protein